MIRQVDLGVRQGQINKALRGFFAWLSWPDGIQG